MKAASSPALSCHHHWHRQEQPRRRRRRRRWATLRWHANVSSIIMLLLSVESLLVCAFTGSTTTTTTTVASPPTSGASVPIAVVVARRKIKLLLAKRTLDNSNDAEISTATTAPNNYNDTMQAAARQNYNLSVYDDDDDNNDDPFHQSWNMSASGSFGTLLMNMQLREAVTGGRISADDVVELDPTTRNETRHTVEDDDNDNDDAVMEQDEIVMPSMQQSPLDAMDWETARELDESVHVLSSAALDDKDWSPVASLLPRGDLYDAMQLDVASLPLLPLSQPAHYQTRINQDRQQLAVNIASFTETVAEWRLFCQEKGGLYPLLRVIMDGGGSGRPVVAADTRPDDVDPTLFVPPSHRRFLAPPPSSGWRHDDPHRTQSCCRAARAVRDLCAISPEVAAIITDGILRTNAAGHGQWLAQVRDLLTASLDDFAVPHANTAAKDVLRVRKSRRDAKLRCKQYLCQLLLAMVVSSDNAVQALRATPGLADAVLSCSSYARKERRRRWLRYPAALAKWIWTGRRQRRPFMQAAQVSNDLNGQICQAANQILAAIGVNQWIPKIPGQKGLRILCLDGGGSRGMAAITAVNCMMRAIGNGVEVADSFDIIAGTSTGGIIAFLTGLRQKPSGEAVEMYDQLIKQVFVKSALSTPLMLFTTASYDESPFMNILSDMLTDLIMLDSRADPAVPLVFCVTSKMSSTPTHVALFRNYNYAAGELADPFTIDPDQARNDLKLPLELEHEHVQNGSYANPKISRSSPGQRVSAGSRHPGSFRVLQRYALRASTAAPTVFKPVMMGGEMYCDGGIVASNPTSVAIHEARTLFPDIPIELVVSFGTGAFMEQKSAPRIGWDGIIGQIVNSATDGEQIHHILEDILGDTALLGGRSMVSGTKYYRFNPVIGMPDEFPIDVTDPEKLARLRSITREYMNEPLQAAKLEEIGNILRGRKKWRSRSFARK